MKRTQRERGGKRVEVKAWALVNRETGDIAFGTFCRTQADLRSLRSDLEEESSSGYRVERVVITTTEGK